MTAWQPIETAPKDGTHVLLWGNYHHAFSGYYGDKWVDKVGWHASGGMILCDTIEPTHWMPLPQPPKVAS